MYWYFTILAKRPYIIILVIIMLCCTCIMVSFTTTNLPDFSDPTLGFETRGTHFSKRLIAWHNLLVNTGPGRLLIANPNHFNFYKEHFNVSIRLFKESRFRRINSKHRNRKTKHNGKNKNISKKQKNINYLKKLKAMKSGITNEICHEDKNSTFPNDDFRYDDKYAIFDLQVNESEYKNKKKKRHFPYWRNRILIDEDHHRENIESKTKTWRLLQEFSSPLSLDENNNMHSILDGYFCDSPIEKYSHFVIERINHNSMDTLFDLDSFLAICDLQELLTGIHNYENYCQKPLDSNECCRPWSLANYAAILANKTSCFQLTNNDILRLQNLLLTCYMYYRDSKLSDDCVELNRCHVPSECIQNNMVFNIMHYFTDYNFIKNNDTNVLLKYSMIFLPVARTTKILPLFYKWDNLDLSNKHIHVIAMDLGLDNELFNELLLTDVWLVALGGLFVMTCMWLYTNSMFVTCMTCVAVIFTLGLSYFIYSFVFLMSFFPYMNLLAVVVIMGIGADDAFIFVKIWKSRLLLERNYMKYPSVKSFSRVDELEPSREVILQDVMTVTVCHAAVSMFVTSITTSVAFYASYTSHITAIKCFGIFSGTAVMMNYLLMITWLPATVSIHEHLRYNYYWIWEYFPIHKLIFKFHKSIQHICCMLENFIIKAVLNYSAIWFGIFGGLGIFCSFIVLYKPGLQLPENTHFQLFVSTHPFELYSTKFKKEFGFEKRLDSYENFKMPLRFIWGIQPIDDGDPSDPFKYGSLHFDTTFDVSTKEAQIWLLTFCQSLKQQEFYEPNFGLLLSDCFIENFVTLMDRRCLNSMNGVDQSPCCNVSKFPFEKEVFNQCLPEIFSSLYSTPPQFFRPGVAGPRFMSTSFNKHQYNLKKNTLSIMKDNVLTNISIPVVKAVVIEFESKMIYSMVYQDVKNFVYTIENWFNKIIQSAPREMRGGWFISELKFFDVQDSLSSGTLTAMLVAMISSLVVLLLVTCNVLVSLFAVLTVTFTIFVTLTILIFIGWKLNILESVTVSTAIGLAVDFSLHYGIHYRLAPTRKRSSASRFALTRIIGPTAMAAITTSIAGALMIFSNVLPYIQIGIFLVVVMFISWLYATFFLISLLQLFGPQDNFLQFEYINLIKCFKNKNNTKFCQRKMSNLEIRVEQLLTNSNSLTGDFLNSESHELSSLSSNHIIKTISDAENDTFNDKFNDNNSIR